MKLETLRSVLLEEMNNVNFRPLTHISIGGYEPLTPNHFFLLGDRIRLQTPTPFQMKFFNVLIYGNSGEWFSRCQIPSGNVGYFSKLIPNKYGKLISIGKIWYYSNICFILFCFE